MPVPATPARALRLLVSALATLLLPVTGALVAAPAHAAPGTVVGHVYDAVGDPLAGVTVTALVAPSYASSAAATTTGSTGEFQLPLAQGTYRLQLDRSGYAPAHYGGGSGVDLVVDDTGQVAVDGQPVEDNLLDDVTLTSTATHQVTGTVRDTDGAGLGGIAVQAFDAGDRTTPFAEVTTVPGSGAYTLDLPTGIYVVRYTDPSGSHVAQWYGGDEPVDVAVSAARSLDPVALAVAAPSTRFPVAGTVVDALGDPVAGVVVDVTGVGGSEDSGTGTTGADGTYGVPVLPGSYRVQLARTGWVTTAYGGSATPSTITVAPDGTLAVAPAEAVTGNRLAAVELRSTPFAVTGVVSATDGSPLGGITVRAFREGSTDPADLVDLVDTDTSGSYTLNLPVGAYDLDYVDDDGVSPAYATRSLASVHVTQGGGPTVDGTPVTSLPEQRLALSAADTPHPVLGSVVDVNGDPVDGLVVSAVPTRDGAAASTTTGADGNAGDHGRYRLSLVPGSYEVTVAGGAHWRDTSYAGGGVGTADVTVLANGAVAVNGTAMAGWDLGPTAVDGRTTYPLGGTVTDGSAALAGIAVTAYAESDPSTPVATTTTGADGSWSLAGVSGLTVGSYVVGFAGTVDDVAHEPTWFGGSTPTPVVVAQGGTASVAGTPVAGNLLPVVTLAPSPASVPHAVVGTVVDVNGDPVGSATVTAVPQSGTSSSQQRAVTSGTDGRYRLDVRPGTYRLTYAADGFTGATSVDVVVDLDGVVVVDSSPVDSGELRPVVLDDAVGTATVSGRVVDTDARPVAGASVEVLRVADLPGASPVATTTTSATGAWTVTGLRIGTYVVRFADGVTPPVVGGPFTVGQGDRVSVDGAALPDGALGDTVLPAVVQPPVVQPPVVQPPVVQPPVASVPRAGVPTIWEARSGARGGRSTATARWGFPADGGAVVSYRVQVRGVTPSGRTVRRTVVVRDASARALEIALAPGTYRFRVCAVDASGRSAWSDFSDRVAAR
ncbi:carboxypeptidase regulatory-like domain-containing protein [Nocardioides okcheonensis]|uniref:carboxypeptidase regulatory-like domain-containing protein n=1 Tax=Nocardioides okcheonensis TaxID=2894081 RepID=UPI001E42D077|nr:carboxypeptidase regulatory-like domain-containing protein [Nocardioides okcheonensis]UFN44134.1 carboxypeptidase regulatory-like domain-containing protein [Nocardioides okcheonensis]